MYEQLPVKLCSRRSARVTSPLKLCLHPGGSIPSRRYVGSCWAVLSATLLLAGAPSSAQAAEGSCRASAARSSGPQQVTFEPVIANPSSTPCVSETHEFVGTTSTGGMSVTDPRATTEATAETLSASASDDSAAVSGSTAISVGHVAVKQVESCSDGVSVASGSSSVDGLTVAGTPVSVIGGKSIDRTVAGVRIRTNQLSGNTRQALVLNFDNAEYVLGEATAGGDACALSNGGAPGGAGAGGGAATGSGGSGSQSSHAGASGSALASDSGVNVGSLADRVDASRLALQCLRSKITLIDVLRRGTHVELIGAADTSLAGRTVAITLLASHKHVASAVVQPDGFFAATAALPAPKIRFTNRARYQARIGVLHSSYLKLTRRMLVESISSHGGKVTIRGQVIRPLAEPRATILVKRRVSCSSTRIVRRIKPSANGAFTVTLKAPAGTPAALYVATTRVRRSVDSRKTYPTATLPRVVVIQ